MKIYNSSGSLVLDAPCEDTSFRHRVIMGDHNLTLKYSLAVHVEIPVGSYCTFEGQTYTLKRPENLKMKHSRDFEYTVLFESPQADTKMWKFRNTVDGRLKFPLTAKPHEHLEMLVANLNRRGSGWTVGDCIEGSEHLINYDHDYCWDALGKMAQEFKTEFEINNKRVSLKKVEYNKTSPLALSYGKGNGFRSGIGRTSEGNPPVEFLFVQGGTRNIDRSKYGSSTLLLPKNQTYEYNGRTYRVDDKGLSISRTDKSPSTYAEDSLSLEDIYPSREGVVSELITVDAGSHLYDFTDTDIPNSLDFSECQIEGEKMTVVFQTGMLAGHGEFEVNYYHTVKGSKKAKRFEIVPKDEDGYTMPDATFKPAAGDKYIVLNIHLPEVYICDNENQTGAEWEMFKEAVRYMYDHEDNEFSFTGELDPLWAKNDWVNIGGKIVLGGYVQFTDSRFQPQGVLVRITGVKDYINKPHKPEIELSNKPVSPSFLSELRTIEAQEVQIDDTHRDAISFTKRRFRDAKETMDMLSDLLDAGFDNFSENINPIAIQTMQLLVGDESLQYRFVTNKTNPATKAHNVTYNQAEKQLSAPAGILQHLTLGINTLSNTHKASEYKFWDIAAYTSAKLTDPSKKYYLYVRVLRSGTTGEFLLRETAIRMDAEASYYYLLYGILNSEYENERSFVSLYGFTEVLPGRVTTDRVVSGDGNSYFDMLNNAMRLGASGQDWGLDFNSKGDGKLRLKGTLVQSQSGDEQPLGVFRGWWNASYVYYYGDEVLYLTGGQIITYRCISTTPISGADKPPTNTTYWQFVARGVRGDFPATAFIRLPEAAGTPSAPTGGSYDSPVPTSTINVPSIHATFSWSDGIPDGDYQLWASTRIFKGDGSESSWETPRKMTDTATYDVEFAPMQTNDAAPAAPTDNNRHKDASPYGYSGQVWFDPDKDKYSASGVNRDFTKMYWRAEREYKNGEWGDWTVVRIKGEKGDTGQSSFPSTMFVRMNDNPTKPAASEGSFSDPSPTNCLAGKNSNNADVYWSDGIPSGSNKLWATTRIFTSDGLSPQQSEWSTPRQMTDTATYDVEFAKEQADDATPATPTDANRHGGSGTQVWFDPVDDNSEDFTKMCWMAERFCENGKWSSWVIIRIKGEKGDSGNFYEYRYCVNGSPKTAPDIQRSKRNPSVGSTTWSTDYPTSIALLQYLWMTVAQINGKTGELVTNWSIPIRQNPVDALQLGENLVNNSEEKETFNILNSYYQGVETGGQYLETRKYLREAITPSAIISAQVRVTLTGCSPKSGGGQVLVYMNGTAAWPTIGQQTGITSSNITLDLKNENFAYNTNGGTMYPKICIRLNNFNEGGTVTVERIKVEYGTGCTAWSLSEDDKIVPATPFRGVYSSSKTYYGSIRSVDLVKYNNHYYVARTDAGAFTNQAPMITVDGSQVLNSSYWNDFGAEFESIATTLLLAELANIAGFIFRNNRLESQKMADGSTNSGATTSTPMVLLDGLTGLVKFAGGKVTFNANGSVEIGSGTKVFTIDTAGNVKMKNIDAEGGTFKGVINCNGGLIMPVKKVSSNSVVLTAETNILICQNTYLSGSDKMDVSLPANPNTGQVLTIINNNSIAEVKIYGNGHRICPSNGDSGTSTKSWSFGYYLLLATVRAKQFVFDGSNWWQINMFDGY